MNIKRLVVDKVVLFARVRCSASCAESRLNFYKFFSISDALGALIFYCYSLTNLSGRPLRIKPVELLNKNEFHKIQDE